MKKTIYKWFSLIAIIAIVLNLTLDSCKKDKLESRYASQFQHKWELKSISKRNTVIGSYIGPWNTDQIASGLIYKDFKSDGTFSYFVSGSVSYSGTYYFLSDSVVIYPHPATVTMPYATPDTSIIRYIDNNIYVSYTRQIFSSPNYSTLDEQVDTLIR